MHELYKIINIYNGFVDLFLWIRFVDLVFIVGRMITNRKVHFFTNQIPLYALDVLHFCKTHSFDKIVAPPQSFVATAEDESLFWVPRERNVGVATADDIWKVIK